MILLRFVIIIYLVSFTYCYANESTNVNTILVLGDSLSAAYGIDVEHGWVNLLQQRINEKYPKDNNWRVVNASVSGETTAGGLARLPNLLEVHQPVLCIIQLGANNGLRGQPVALMKQQLDQILQLCNQVGTTLLLGIKLPPNYGEKYTQTFEQVYSDLAVNHNISLVPFILDGVALKSNYMQKDGLHPTAEAQNIILENVWPSFDELLHTFK